MPVESLDDYLPALSTRLTWCGSVAVHFVESQVGELEKLFGYLLGFPSNRRKRRESWIASRPIEGNHDIKRSPDPPLDSPFGCVGKSNPVSKAFRARVRQFERIPFITPSESQVDRFRPPWLRS